MDILIKLPAAIAIVIMSIYIFKKHGITRALIFPIILTLVYIVNYFIKNLWSAFLIVFPPALFIFIFFSGSVRTSLFMMLAIKKNNLIKAINIGEKALAGGETSIAIKANLMAAYFKKNDYPNVRKILASIDEGSLSSTDKKVVELWKHKLAETKTDENRNI